MKIHRRQKACLFDTQFGRSKSICGDIAIAAHDMHVSISRSRQSDDDNSQDKADDNEEGSQNLSIKTINKRVAQKRLVA
ncbi:unnamed protein product [Anisakis simplex]|uniref:Uncharacterized protein n=1 Tax=Anisakis simplex TaxID=6269 RepID=A0A0M3K6S3_ANISI|nr:unnamed protein product [Anisakis simplex]